jgi:Transglycosylase-like domain
MQWPEPAPTEQSLGALARAQTKGGAVRTRIALTTMTIVVAVPVLLLTFVKGDSSASARESRHERLSQASHTISQPLTQQRLTKIDFTLMSYAQAEKVDSLIDYSRAVTQAQEESYLRTVSLYQTVELQNFYKGILQQQAARAADAAAAATAAAARPAPVNTAPATAPEAVAAPPTAGSDASSTATADWACIREHESGDNYSEAGGGAYQFEFDTWHALTGLPSPAQDYPPSVQDAAALQLFAQRGWQPWTTRGVCGL